MFTSTSRYVALLRVSLRLKRNCLRINEGERRLLADAKDQIVNYKKILVVWEDKVLTQVVPTAYTMEVSRLGRRYFTVNNDITKTVIFNCRHRKVMLLEEDKYRELCRNFDDKIAISNLEVCRLLQEIDQLVRQERSIEEVP